MLIERLAYYGKVYRNCSPEELLAQGVPQSVIDTAIAEATLAHCKQICRTRIYGVASAEAQMSMAQMAGLIGARTASARNADETDVLAGIQAFTDWVTDMRAAAADIAAGTQNADWPDCPQDAINTAAKF